MQPKIEVIGDVNKCLQYIKWAKQQWSLREGQWQKQLDTCLVFFKRQGDSGYILFQTFGLKGLVTNPHKAINSQFVLDATKDPLWVMDREGWPPLESSSPDQDKEIQVGNYYVLDKDDNVYSIKVPHHNLVIDVGSSVKGYTQYSWTTNVSMEDVYTCYSEYVYSEGEPVFAGTMAPPEAAFKYGLIVGIGIDDKDVLHIAQFVQVPKDYGYWKIERDGSNIGTFFGTFANASEKGVPTLIWKNESADKKWFIEFLTCDNGLDSELVTNLNIYRREHVGRSTAQWFYKDGTWSQYTSRLPTKFKFDGIQEEGGLKKTRYSQVLDVALVNSKPVVANHVATSLSGVIRNKTEINLPIMIEPWATINIVASDDWPAENSYISVTMSKPECVSITLSTTLPNLTLTEIKKDAEYRYVLNTKCVVGQSAKTISGVVTATTSFGQVVSYNASYVSKLGGWWFYSETPNPHTLTGLSYGPTYYTQSGYFLTETYTSYGCGTWDGEPYIVGGNAAGLCYGDSGLTATDVTLDGNQYRLGHSPDEWDWYAGENYVGTTRVVPTIIMEPPWPLCKYYSEYPLGYYWSNYHVVIAKRVYEWRC